MTPVGTTEFDGPRVTGGNHLRESGGSPFVFVSERGAPLTAPGFSRMIERAVTSARLRIRARAHMLRHACGYKLANDGVDTRSLQAYLGHCNIENTTRYTALAPDRFKGFLERLMEAFTARALEKTRSARKALRPRNVANARNRQGGEPYSRFLSTLGL